VGSWCDFNKVKFSFFSFFEGFAQIHDAELFTFTAYQTNFTGGNFAIDSWFFFLSDSNISFNNLGLEPW